MIIKQYPHYLFAVNAGSESIQDENGNWGDSEVTNTFISMCREETDGRGSEVQVAGGTFHRFTSLVQLPKGVQRVEVGTNVFVADNADGTGIRVQGVVLKFDEGQLHSRLWV
jgi:hypothetical protein